MEAPTETAAAEATVTEDVAPPDPEIIQAFRTILKLMNQSGEVLRDTPRRAAKVGHITA